MSNRVRYAVSQSPFFKLSSKKRLAELLKFPCSELFDLAKGTSYNVFLNEKGREIQHPIGQLGVIHKKIGKYLGRLALPDYVKSKKGSSYVANAKEHTGYVPVIKTDISRFYPSVTFEQIYRLFLAKFKCEPDISWLLAKICTYRGTHLPTGSEISGIVAFLANQDMFDDIHTLALQNQCKMTCYVDDIVLSGPKANKRLLVMIRWLIRLHGLNTKDDKSKTFTANAPKTITGCIVRGDRVLLPNRRHLAISKLQREISVTTDNNTLKSLKASLRGRLQEAKQILPNR